MEQTVTNFGSVIFNLKSIKDVCPIKYLRGGRKNEIDVPT